MESYNRFSESIFASLKPWKIRHRLPDDWQLQCVVKLEHNLSQSMSHKLVKGDVASIRGNEWLNDTVIDMYIELIVKRSEEQVDLPKLKATTVFLFNAYAKGGYKGIASWLPKDLFDADIVVFPIHSGSHWFLALVDTRKRVIWGFDSIFDYRMDYFEKVRSILIEHAAECYPDDDYSNWEIHINGGTPKQDNGQDCGVFVCQFVKFVTAGYAPEFTQTYMHFFRRMMTYELLTGKLLPV